MKFSVSVLILFVLLVFAFAGGVFDRSSSAQVKRHSEKRVAATVKRLGSKGSIRIIPPSEAGQLGSLLGDPCDFAAPIEFGQTIQGSLTAADCQLDDGTFADFYVFTGTATQTVTIDMSSGMFDTYLGLANLSGTFVVEDDDGGGGTNSRIIANLPETGVYVILANAFDPNTFGNYSLGLAGSTVCTVALTPTQQSVPGAGGTFTFNVETQDGCSWSTNYDIYGFINFVTSGGIGPGTVSYTVQPNNTGADRSMVIRVRGQDFTINQTFLVCTYSINPLSASHGPDAVTAEFMMNTPEGCPWIASYSGTGVWTSTELKRGPGPVVYTLSANNGGDRSSSITVAGHTFNIDQSGRNCTYSVSPQSLTISPAGTQNGLFTVNTQAGCTWNFSGGFNYVYFPDGYGGIGPGSKSFTVWPNYNFAPRSWIIQFSGLTTSNIGFTQNGIPYRTRFDFFGDSRADVGVFRPSTGQWYLINSAAPSANNQYSFGLGDDVLVPADYTGDRSTDVAVFRPSNGTWYFRDAGTGSYSSIAFGTTGDIPSPADYDGDGKADLAVFRPSTGFWFILRSTDLSVDIIPFGLTGDNPVPADFDADGRADIAIYRPSVGEWWIRQSNDGQVFAAQFGNSADRTVQGDFTGDGRADIAIWRPSNGFWYVLRSEDGSYYSFPFGTLDDIPVPADYDADGVIDAAVFRPSSSTWYINRSSLSVQTIQYGSAGDIPIPSVYVR